MILSLKYSSVVLWNEDIMKKIIFAFLMISFVFCEVVFSKPLYNAQVNSAIQMYKNKNYTECLQVMIDVVNQDPSNVVAYYYIAISQARLGNVDRAKEAYQRVIDLNTSTQLARYSRNGLNCLNQPEMCKSSLDFGSSKKALDNVSETIEENRIQAVKDIVNTKNNIQEVPVEYMKKFKDYSLPQNQIQNKSELPVPSKDEIATALDTLKRAGYQNYLPQPPLSAEQMQMSMINSINHQGNSGFNNPMANFIPYMSNSTDMSQVSPELIQSMMLGSMMQGLYTDNNQR